MSRTFPVPEVHRNAILGAAATLEQIDLAAAKGSEWAAKVLAKENDRTLTDVCGKNPKLPYGVMDGDEIVGLWREGKRWGRHGWEACEVPPGAEMVRLDGDDVAFVARAQIDGCSARLLPYTPVAIIAAFDSPSASVLHAYREELHPRGRDGKFIEKFGWVDIVRGRHAGSTGQVVSIETDPREKGNPIIRVNIGDDILPLHKKDLEQSKKKAFLSKRGRYRMFKNPLLEKFAEMGLGGDVAAAVTAATVFDPLAHPRDFIGRFIQAGGRVRIVTGDRKGQRGTVTAIVPTRDAAEVYGRGDSDAANDLMIIRVKMDDGSEVEASPRMLEQAPDKASLLRRLENRARHMGEDVMLQGGEDTGDQYLREVRRASLTAAFDPLLHPRDFIGRFIEVGGRIKFVSGRDKDKRGTVTEIRPYANDPENPTIRIQMDDGTTRDALPKEIEEAPEKATLGHRLSNKLREFGAEMKPEHDTYGEGAADLPEPFLPEPDRAAIDDFSAERESRAAERAARRRAAEAEFGPAPAAPEPALLTDEEIRRRQAGTEPLGQGITDEEVDALGQLYAQGEDVNLDALDPFDAERVRNRSIEIMQANPRNYVEETQAMLGPEPSPAEPNLDTATLERIAHDIANGRPGPSNMNTFSADDLAWLDSRIDQIIHGRTDLGLPPDEGEADRQARRRGLARQQLAGSLLGAVDLPPGTKVLAVVDDMDRNAVLDTVAVLPGPKIMRRHDGQWMEDPGWVSVLRSVRPPPVVVLDEGQVASVIEQIDESTAGQKFVATKPGARTAAGLLARGDEMVIEWSLRGLNAAGGAGNMPGKLARYWRMGEGAAKIRWGTPGAMTRCAHHLAKYVGPGRAYQVCNNLSKPLGGKGVAWDVS